VYTYPISKFIKEVAQESWRPYMEDEDKKTSLAEYGFFVATFCLTEWMDEQRWSFETSP